MEPIVEEVFPSGRSRRRSSKEPSDVFYGSGGSNPNVPSEAIVPRLALFLGDVVVSVGWSPRQRFALQFGVRSGS
jgi:hypothetical protein